MFVKHVSKGRLGYNRPGCDHLYVVLTVSVKKTLLRRRRPLGGQAFTTPNQGEDRSFCCWTAEQRLAQKYCCFPDASDRGTAPASRFLCAGKWRSLPCLRPISLLRSSLLRSLDSNFPEIYLWAWEFQPLRLTSCLSQTL